MRPAGTHPSHASTQPSGSKTCASRSTPSIFTSARAYCSLGRMDRTRRASQSLASNTVRHGESSPSADWSDGCHAASALVSLCRMGAQSEPMDAPSEGSHGWSHACIGTGSLSGFHSSTALRSLGSTHSTCSVSTAASDRTVGCHASNQRRSGSGDSASHRVVTARRSG